MADNLSLSCKGMTRAEHSLGPGQGTVCLCSNSEEESSFQPTAVQSMQHFHGTDHMLGRAVVQAYCLI